MAALVLALLQRVGAVVEQAGRGNALDCFAAPRGPGLDVVGEVPQCAVADVAEVCHGADCCLVGGVPRRGRRDDHEEVDIFGVEGSGVDDDECVDLVVDLEDFLCAQPERHFGPCGGVWLVVTIVR